MKVDSVYACSAIFGAENLGGGGTRLGPPGSAPWGLYGWNYGPLKLISHRRLDFPTPRNPTLRPSLSPEAAFTSRASRVAPAVRGGGACFAMDASCNAFLHNRNCVAESLRHALRPWKIGAASHDQICVGCVTCFGTPTSPHLVRHVLLLCQLPYALR